MSLIPTARRKRHWPPGFHQGRTTIHVETGWEVVLEVRGEQEMISINVPGWGNMEIENIVLDLNGTIATDGKVSVGVKEKINFLSGKAKCYILTADTQGTAGEESSGMNVELLKVSKNDSSEVKRRVLESLDPTRTVAIGNGNNDRLVLKEAALGIAVLGQEGTAASAVKAADIVARDILSALDLLLKPKRLMATLLE
jgi:soluble P-type ATPase